MILTLTSPIDSNVPTRSALVLETKNSFVSLVTNLTELKKKTMFVSSDVSYVNTSTKIVISLVSVGIVVQCYRISKKGKQKDHFMFL